MTSVQGCGHFHKKYPYITFPNFSPSPLKLGDELSDQPTGLLRANFSITIVPSIILSVSKYIEEDWQ